MQNWYDLHYTNRARLSVVDTQITIDHTGFVLMIDLSLLNSSFWSIVQSDLRDIRFTTGNGVTEIPFEIVRYDYGANTGTVYLRTDFLDSTATEIYFYLYYGNPFVNTYAATDQYGSQAVWSDNGYEAVYHFTETPLIGATIKDSTANARHGTVVGSALTQVSTSQAGGGYEFILNENHYINTVDFDLHGTDLELTISALVKPGNSNGTIVSHNDAGNNVPFHLNVTGSGSASRQGFLWNTSGWKGASLGTGNLQNSAGWTTAAGTLLSNSTSMTARYYANGSQAAQASLGASNPVQDSANPMTIGAHVTQGEYYVGTIDEVRIASDVRAPEWLQLEYTMFRTPSNVYSFDLYEVYTESELIAIQGSSGACNICLDVRMPDETTFSRLDLREIPKIGFIYAIVDIEKTNKPQSFYSTQIELPDTKNNAEVLKRAYLVNHEKSLIGVELDCRLTINGVILDSATGKFIITSATLDEETKDVSYKGRIIGSRYLWLNDIKDQKFCEGHSFLDSVTIEKSNVPTTWDKTVWNWPKGYTMIPVNYGKWSKLFSVNYNDLRPSVYVRYLLNKGVGLSNYRIVSDFMQSDLFSSLILPYVREDYGVAQEFADKNEFLASIPLTKQRVNLGISPSYLQSTVGGYTTKTNLIELTDESYTNNNNEYISNFDSGYNFNLTTYTVPANVYNGLRIKFLVSYTLAWVDDLNRDLFGVEYDGYVQPQTRDRLLVTDYLLDTGQWYPTRYTTSMGYIDVKLIHKDGNTLVETELATKRHDIKLHDLSTNTGGDDDPWSGVFNVEESCFNEGDEVFIRMSVNQDKRTTLVKKPSSWNTNKLRTLETTNPSFEFGPTPPGYAITKIVVDDFNFGCEISNELCGDFNTNIADMVHCDITIKNLIDALTHMFNLVWQTDPINKVIYVEPDPTFYYINGQNDDWSGFLDKSKEIELKPNQTNNLTCERLLYKADSGDGYVQAFQESNAVNYLGQDTCPTGLSATSIVEKPNPLFAPTHYIFDNVLIAQANKIGTQYLPPVFLRMWKEYEPTQRFLEEKNFGFAPRIVYYSGLKSYNFTIANVTYETAEWVYEGTNYSTFPHAYMVNPYDTENGVNMSFTKNVYRHLKGELSSVSGYTFAESLYEQFWEDFQERQLTNTTMTCYLKMGMYDIKQLDFRKPKHLLNARWLLSKITEWNPCLKTAKAQLVLGEKIDRDYLAYNTTQADLSSFIVLGARNGNVFVELGEARFGEWKLGLYQIAGQVRNNVTGYLQGATPNTVFTLEFDYQGTTHTFNWPYDGTIHLTSTLPDDNQTLWNTNYKPFIVGGQLDAFGNLYFLFDKRGWATLVGYSDTIIPANTKANSAPHTQVGASGSAVDLNVSSYMSYYSTPTASSTITMKPFITPFNSATTPNEILNTEIKVEDQSGWKVISQNKERFDQSDFNFYNIDDISAYKDIDTVPVLITSHANPTTAESWAIPTTTAPADAVVMIGVGIESDELACDYISEIATYYETGSGMDPEYAYIKVQFIEDIHPTYDSVNEIWKPSGTLLFTIIKHADQANGVMYELEPSGIAQSSYGGFSSSTSITLQNATPQLNFYEEEDVEEQMPARYVINEAGGHYQKFTISWADSTGGNPETFDTAVVIPNVYERY